MSWLQALLLGLIQGLTEFIPVSSSGHLVLAHELMGVEKSGLVFDVALHIGTFLALVALFWRDILQLIKSVFIHTEKTRLAWLLAAATLPAVVFGILLQEAAETTFRSPLIVAIMLISVALVMFAAEKYAERLEYQTSLEKVGWRQAIFVGFAQAVALIPGVSRSGSTITAGMFSGINRIAATRFSFLLALPVTFGAIIKVMVDSDTIGQIKDEQGIFLIGIACAFISGLFAIKFLLRFLANHSLHLFAYYRLVLGGIVLLTLIIG